MAMMIDPNGELEKKNARWLSRFTMKQPGVCRSQSSCSAAENPQSWSINSDSSAAIIVTTMA